MNVVDSLNTEVSGIKRISVEGMPQGLQFEVIATSPDVMKFGYQEGTGTNETTEGMIERAELASKSPVESLWGVGHPIKLAAQAALLHPGREIGLIDLSLQNVFDAMVLFASFKAGYTSVTSFLHSSEGAAYHANLSAFFPNEEEAGRINPKEPLEFDTSIERLTREDGTLIDPIPGLDTNLARLCADLGVSVEKVAIALRDIDISVMLGDMKNTEVLQRMFIGETSPTAILDTRVCDISNIPIDLSALEMSNDVLIFYAVSQREEAYRALGFDGFFDQRRLRYSPGNTIWTYQTKNRTLPVGMATPAEYEKVRSIIDRTNTW